MEESYSPNGTYQIVFDVYELRMSHWVYNPSIYRTNDQVLLFDLREDMWSADVVNWLTDSTVRIEARRYPGDMSCQLTLDLEAGTGKATRSTQQGTAHFDGTLPDVKNWILSRKPIIY